jgi:hypothetical protein
LAERDPRIDRGEISSEVVLEVVPAGFQRRARLGDLCVGLLLAVSQKVLELGTIGFSSGAQPLKRFVRAFASVFVELARVLFQSFDGGIDFGQSRFCPFDRRMSMRWIGLYGHEHKRFGFGL